MAASLFKLSSFTVFLCIALLLSSPNENVEAALCGSLSKTFRGICRDSRACNARCLSEGAVSGSCHPLGFGFACFYFRNCRKCKSHSLSPAPASIHHYSASTMHLLAMLSNVISCVCVFIISSKRL